MYDRLTTIAHNHNFSIDTVFVPGPPVRIHARIGGHRSGSRGKEGTRKEKRWEDEGGDKGGEREGEEKEKEAGGKGREERRD